MMGYNCLFQNLRNISHSILVQFLSGFFSILYFMVHPYSTIDTNATWKKSFIILSDISNFHMIDNHSIAIHTFPSCILTSLSVDEILLLKYVNLSTNFRRLPFRMWMAPSRSKHAFRSVCVHVEANASCWLIPAMQQRFGLDRCCEHLDEVSNRGF